MSTSPFAWRFGESGPRGCFTLAAAPVAHVSRYVANAGVVHAAISLKLEPVVRAWPT